MATTTDISGGDGASLSILFDCLASDPRRRLLGHASDRAPDFESRKRFTRHLAAREREKPPDRATGEERSRALARLRRVHSPKLEAAGLIERDAERVVIADHPAYEDTGIVEAIREHAGSRSLDALFESLADPGRRTVPDAVSRQYHRIRTDTLTREILARTRGSSERGATTEAFGRIVAALRRVHHPQLDEAGLIEYDTGEQTVGNEGHPLLCVAWTESRLGANFRERLAKNSADSGVLTLEGRENIISWCQSLCEEADEELTVLFTTTGLLEAGRFSCLERAAERGADVYLRTHDATVREFVRERVPGVTLREPKINCLSLPVEGEKVGQLVFADRRAIVLGKKSGEGPTRSAPSSATDPITTKAL